MATQIKSHSNTIIGAIAGDIIGSAYECDSPKSTSFKLLRPEATFTDDTVQTIAIADSLLNKKDFAKNLSEYGKNYPDRGYGKNFSEWIHTQSLLPYNSFGNGSAMRVSPVGFMYDNLEKVIKIAKQSAEVTHDHLEGIKGAQAIAAAVFLARIGKSKHDIKNFIIHTFVYDLDFTINSIRSTYTYDDSCQNTVPQAIVAFLESTDYENAIRLAISLGGDSDTLACMTGGIAAAYYKEIPAGIIDFASARLPAEFVNIINAFDLKINE
ncbi:MAG TPA: ADP-ribosylglycohydrolase family protein [Bacteroidales bacterium]|jgi:ADP-ribosylglycohydrolase|nr:ADP-ribosylglycohydrolase family protein [Bacteroidales bacterium]HOR81901.1 ADP-ribosylglycohydrolase family protein [Bacteroidales bacterium]HPJ91133.1 ADP-ribosylglycohydrolase family protein [Bacteroidales bacterium]HPX59585.1 ADP-ribosylglycohydrolase family protein [Bacteroidales bacterium]HQB20285.1 ADP-ribosylglycohydrolase family protein [Bacteroidales bacterium]